MEEELEKREIDQINKHYENKNLINRLKKENKRYKQALEEMLLEKYGSEGIEAERELGRVTEIAIKALEESE